MQFKWCKEEKAWERNYVCTCFCILSAEVLSGGGGNQPGIYVHDVMIDQRTAHVR